MGVPTVFVRLTGCPLRCGYCDTTHAFQGGRWLGLAEIASAVAAYPTRHVCVTGGEPLAQKACQALLSALCDAGYDVALETSGALDVAEVDARVARIVDVKTPGSGEAGRNLWANLGLLGERDEVKFVLLDEADYRWAAGIQAQYRIAERCEVLFSPVHGRLAARDLAEWILRDGLPVRMQVQLHKLLWGEEQGR
ncbi:MAG: 7-carboxy-7-deazaguanine synthase QueE [Gallionellaceae bacterium]|nr:7-carboxy-7-deazaguanine synthase QueE [Gallionellaceae bacterium]MDD5364126.1 7-carboxy-7-deazaguanine synthase QueE [Gallionellaceae bacterium]